MSPFVVEEYNKLLRIKDAHEQLSKQLDSTGKSLNDLLTDPEITKLFIGGDDAPSFGICILHRHYTLEPGERMVSSVPDPETAPHNSITEPSIDISPTICADRWMLSGMEFEHTIQTTGPPISPPSQDFFEKFRRICDKFNVNILGICAPGIPMGLTADQGLTFLEQPDGPPTKRRQKTTLVSRHDFDQIRNKWQSAWVPVQAPPADVNLVDLPDLTQYTTTPAHISHDKTQKFSMLSCVHNCTDHIC